MISAALAVLKNDEERNAQSEIYTKNINSFYSIAFSKLHNAHDSEDAIQEAFLAIARNPDNFFAIPQENKGFIDQRNDQKYIILYLEQ